MTEPRAQRRLAAILAADVVGYSRLIGLDESGTLARLRDLWGMAFTPAVTAFRGRIVKMMGDGALVEFASAVDAVDCALSIQAALAADTGGLVLRMGLNLGDIVIDGDDIFGDGVNVAARLEAQSPEGGILLSDAVWAQVRGKIGTDFADAGMMSLKNIDTPVQTWSWTGRDTSTPPDGAPARATSPEAASADARPSVAVLPFTNMSDDAGQEYFSDGISEDIITDLSKVSGLVVIARNSSFAYKGKSPDIRAVGRDLGVTSVLEGSIRRAGNRVRITAQLIDTTTGGHLWADRYDRDLTDIFAVQDDVTFRIVDALKVTLQPAEKARVSAARTRSPEAHDQFLLGREMILGATRTRDGFDRALKAFRRAIAIDPDYAEPHAGLAMAYVFDFQNKWSGQDDVLALAETHAARAVRLDPDDAFAHFAQAMVAVWRRDLDAGLEGTNRALALNPSFAPGYSARGTVSIYRGAPLDALADLEQARRLDPDHSNQALHFLGCAYLVAGQYETAAAMFRERILQMPMTDFSRAFLASALGHLGQHDEARAVWTDLMAINPAYDVEGHLSRLPFRNPADPARIRDGLTLAGLPP